MNLTDYISPTDAAARWGYHLTYVYLLCRRGRIPGAVQVGRGWWIPRATAEAWQVRQPGRPAQERVETMPKRRPGRPRKEAREG